MNQFRRDVLAIYHGANRNAFQIGYRDMNGHARFISPDTNNNWASTIVIRELSKGSVQCRLLQTLGQLLSPMSPYHRFKFSSDVIRRMDFKAYRPIMGTDKVTIKISMPKEHKNSVRALQQLLMTWCPKGDIRLDQVFNHTVVSLTIEALDINDNFYSSLPQEQEVEVEVEVPEVTLNEAISEKTKVYKELGVKIASTTDLLSKLNEQRAKLYDDLAVLTKASKILKDSQ